MNHKQRLMARANKRRAEMRKLRENRWGLQEIAEKYGISYQRVQQIIAEKRD